VLFCLVIPAFGAAKKSRPKSSKKSASTSARVSTAKKKSSKKTTARRRPRQTWRTGQMQPAPERYIEIQQALIDRGYGAGAADGKWSLTWTEGLKRFQRDQNLEPSGKITSLSLLALGLGPKRETASAGRTPDTQSREPQ
jgi:hypothetical protein